MDYRLEQGDNVTGSQAWRTVAEATKEDQQPSDNEDEGEGEGEGEEDENNKEDE